MERLTTDEWHERARDHRDRAEGLLHDVVERRRRRQRHPVEDFLFDYYNLRPGELLRWHPGAGVELEDPAGDYAGVKFYRHADGISSVDVEGFLARRTTTVDFARRLLSATASNPAHFGCFGMHEWAMVYHLQPDETRHDYLPLRFSPERVAEVTEQVGVRCSHFDAFRFFTPDAEPLNHMQGHEGRPTRERQVELDQPACLHANMDLYKWAGKLLPLVDASLLLDTFVLARDIRELDMRASAYDLAAWGHEPVPVETPQGRADYVRSQRGFAERAAVLRGRLVEVLVSLD